MSASQLTRMVAEPNMPQAGWESESPLAKASGVGRQGIEAKTSPEVKKLQSFVLRLRRRVPAGWGWVRMQCSPGRIADGLSVCCHACMQAARKLCHFASSCACRYKKKMVTVSFRGWDSLWDARYPVWACCSFAACVTHTWKGPPPPVPQKSNFWVRAMQRRDWLANHQMGSVDGESSFRIPTLKYRAGILIRRLFPSIIFPSPEQG
jgi:hypothetical protein